LIGIIPCAGSGTRLASFAGGVPKPLVRIGGRPLVEYSLSVMRVLAVERVVLIVGPHTEQVRSQVGVSFGGLPVEYVMQHSPRGLLDAVHQARHMVDDKFITLLSDEIYVDCRHKDLIEYWDTHLQVDGMVGYIPDSTWEQTRKNYSVVLNGEVFRLLEEKPYRQVNSLLGTGTWALPRAFFDYAGDALRKNSLDKLSFVDVLQLMISDGFRIHGYDLAGRYININSAEDMGPAMTLVERAHWCG